MEAINFNREATLNYVIKPITEASNLFAGEIGTRKVVPYAGVKTGDPLAAFTMPDHVIQSRPTTANIDAGSVTPFGNPTSSKQDWSMNDYFIFPRMHSEVFSDTIGDTTTNEDNSPNDIGTQILNEVATKFKQPILKDVVNTAFWSHTGFDPATDYTATHTFPSKTITSYQKDNGLLPLLKDALDAGDFSNYKSTSATGGIDVDGATLSKANANTLASQMVGNVSRKLRGIGSQMPLEYRPFMALSHDWYLRLREYVADTFKGVESGYKLFTEGTDGKRVEVGYMYDEFCVYNWGFIFDEYWETTNPASKFNHMGMVCAPDNLGVGFNVKSPKQVAGGEAGLRIYPRPEPEMGGAVDLALYLQMDYLINDNSLFSTVGFEQLP